MMMMSGGGGGGGSEASPTAFNGITTTTQQQSMQLAGYNSEGAAIYNPLVSAGDVTGAVVPHPVAPPPSQAAQQQGGFNINNSYMGSGTGTEPVKKKRGRPRKYGPSDPNLSMNILSPPPPPPPPPVAVGTNTTSGAGSASTAAPLKKARGRPPGSTTKKHHLRPMGSVCAGFTPHVITVKAGEDVSSKIMSFSQHGSRTVCILSANGAISNATLCQPATSGGTVTYEGRFEILSLSGSFMLSESGGQRGRSGGLSVSLSGPDGRVLGGGVAGPLTAASPLQVVVGSFIADDSKGSKPGIQVEPLSATSLRSSSPATGPSSPQSRGTLSESPGAPGSPINQTTGACNNHSGQVMSSMPWK